MRRMNAGEEVDQSFIYFRAIPKFETEAPGLAWLNVGGATGGAIFGFIATRIQLRPLTIAVMIGAAAMIFWFGSGADDLTGLTIIVACAGFFTNSAICGMYALFA